jgi:protein SCO1
MRTITTFVMVALLAIAGCRSSQKAENPPATASNFKTYHLRGKVMSTSSATGEVVLNHEAIPGFMEAMTMPYSLKDPQILGELHPGDTITADVLVSQDADATVLLDHIVVVAQGKPDYKPAVQYHVPAPGDEVPDFALRNQDGHPIHLSQFRGKTLLITFIYTRCPMPNFCPLVTRNFAAIDKQLKSNPAIYAKTHMLCISFDPKNDTPKELHAYGVQYIGSDSKTTFAHWDFAVPAKADVDKIAQYFDVGLTLGPDSSITHTLSTTLVGPDGKVQQFYPGNEWTPDQVLADLKHIPANAG